MQRTILSVVGLSGAAAGLVVGLFMAAFSPQLVSHLTGSVQSEQHPLIRNVNDVDRTGWIHFENKEYGFDFYYPPSYVITDTKNSLELQRLDGTLPIITFSKIRNTIVSETANKPFALAGWKVASRQSMVLSTPYFSNATADTLNATYLFVRDFQLNGYGSPLVMLKAEILDTPKDPTFAQARAAGLADIDDALTEAEQILSTVRFLSYAEIYGPSGYQGKDL